MVERKLSNKELNDELKNVSFRSKEKQNIFEQISEQTWFRQYAKGSKDACKKIIKKVKKGINHGKYTYAIKEIESDVRGTTKEKKQKVKPKQKITKKEETKLKQQKKKTEKKIKEPKKVIRNDNRKKKQIEKMQKDTAPSGRKYSATEIREGKGSARAAAWRKRNKINENDWSY